MTGAEPLSRAVLAAIGREYMLFGHLLNRAALPHVHLSLYSWYALLGDAPHPALDAMVQAVNPRARCVPATPTRDERLAWDVVIDRMADPAAMPHEAAMVAASTTAAFAFRGGAAARSPGAS